jgi:dTMP kinase
MIDEQHKNKLLAFEGIDGCGKTSLSKKLAEHLGAAWRKFPNRDTPMGMLIEDHLRKRWVAVRRHEIAGESSRHLAYSGDEHLDGLVFQGLQLANRIESADDFRQTLKTQHIICDRYWPSGYAYGGADGLDKPYMIKLHEGLLQPDLFILFDIEVDIAFERIHGNSGRGNADRYEADRKFLQTVADNYRELWAMHAGDPQWVKINANGTPEESWSQLVKVVTAATG